MDEKTAVCVSLVMTLLCKCLTAKTTNRMFDITAHTGNANVYKGLTFMSALQVKRTLCQCFFSANTSKYTGSMPNQVGLLKLIAFLPRTYFNQSEFGLLLYIRNHFHLNRSREQVYYIYIHKYIYYGAREREIKTCAVCVQIKLIDYNELVKKC